MNIDYNLYKVFLHLYEEKSISKTANKLYVSQPAISYSLKELENSLGYKLFYRNSKGIEPTKEAIELYNYISSAFNILDKAEENIKNLNELNIGTIRIGIQSDISFIDISNYIYEFRNKYPNIKFIIISKPYNEMINLLEERKLDFIIGFSQINSYKKISKILITELNNYFIYNKELLDVDIKNIKDLNKYKIILPNNDLDIRIKLDEYLENNNIRLDTIIEVPSNDIMISMVKKGLGIGYLNENSTNDLEKVNLKLPSTNIYFMYIDDFKSIATKKFIDEVLKEK